MNFSKPKWFFIVVAAGALALSPATVAHERGGGSRGHGHSGGHGSHHGGGSHSFSGHRSGGHHGGFSHHRRHRHHGGFSHHRRHHHHGRSFFFYPYYSAFYGSFYPGYGYWGYYPGYGYGYGGYARGYASGGSIAVEVQSALAELGYYGGAIDGVIGSGTRNAIRRFQRDKGLPVTGRLDARLVDQLGVS